MRDKMKPKAPVRLIITIVILITHAAPSYAENAQDDPSMSMLARYEAIRDQLNNNPFGQPLYLQSNRKENHIGGQLSGVIEHPFTMVSRAFNAADQWCDIMSLHLNVKYCRASENDAGHMLKIFFGRKFHEPLASAYQGDYQFQVLRETESYFKVALTAGNGPFKTRNYRIVLEAVPLIKGQTFIHLTYSYDVGMLARTATSLYFHTAGRDKVGFTIVDRQADGQPVYVQGVLGAMERNIMRYYLALNAYLGALSLPPENQLAQRLQDWFASTERYPLQLRELELSEYMRMKHQEYQRQQSGHERLRPAGPSW
jgi:hypothetical protein